MCHAASWIISGVKAGHGPVWKKWCVSKVGLLTFCVSVCEKALLTGQRKFCSVKSPFLTGRKIEKSPQLILA